MKLDKLLGMVELASQFKVNIIVRMDNFEFDYDTFEGFLTCGQFKERALAEGAEIVELQNFEVVNFVRNQILIMKKEELL